MSQIYLHTLLRATSLLCFSAEKPFSASTDNVNKLTELSHVLRFNVTVLLLGSGVERLSKAVIRGPRKAPAEEFGLGL